MDNVGNVGETLKGHGVTQLKELCREVGTSQCARNKKTSTDRSTPAVLKSAGHEVVSIEKEEEAKKPAKKIKRVPVENSVKKKVMEENKEGAEKMKLDDEKKNSDNVSAETEEDGNDESSVTESPQEDQIDINLSNGRNNDCFVNFRFTCSSRMLHWQGVGINC
eukprot:jgi/Bigna1/144373/aug1.87_g19081